MTSRHGSDRAPNDHHDRFDHRLRRTLEPSPARVERTIAAARERAASRPSRPGGTRVALAAAVIALALAAVFSLDDGPPSGPDPVPPAADLSAITISNLDGPITVSTAAGGRWVVFGSDPTTRQETNP